MLCIVSIPVLSLVWADRFLSHCLGIISATLPSQKMGIFLQTRMRANYADFDINHAMTNIRMTTFDSQESGLHSRSFDSHLVFLGGFNFSSCKPMPVNWIGLKNCRSASWLIQWTSVQTKRNLDERVRCASGISPYVWIRVFLRRSNVGLWYVPSRESKTTWKAWTVEFLFVGPGWLLSLCQVSTTVGIEWASVLLTSSLMISAQFKEQVVKHKPFLFHLLPLSVHPAFVYSDVPCFVLPVGQLSSRTRLLKLSSRFWDIVLEWVNWTG